MANITYIDLFCGAGGMSLGFDNAGFSNIFSVEFNDTFATTYKNNFPDHNLFIGGTITYLSFEPCCKKLQEELKDTSLSNLNHISSEEEEKVYQDIIDVKEFDEEPYE